MIGIDWGNFNQDHVEFCLLDDNGVEWDEFVVKYLERLDTVYSNVLNNDSGDRVYVLYVLPFSAQRVVRYIIEHPSASSVQKVLIILSTLYNVQDGEYVSFEEINAIVSNGVQDVDSVESLMHGQNYAYPFFKDNVNVLSFFKNFVHYRSWFYRHGFLFNKLTDDPVDNIVFPLVNRDYSGIPRSVLLRAVYHILENTDCAPVNKSLWDLLTTKDYVMLMYYVGPYAWFDGVEDFKQKMVDHVIDSDLFFVRKKVDNDRNVNNFGEDMLWLLNNLIHYAKNPRGIEQMNAMLNFLYHLTIEDCFAVVLSSYNEHQPHPIDIFYAFAESGFDYPHTSFLNVIKVKQLNDKFKYYQDGDDLYMFMLLNDIVSEVAK